MRATGPPQIDHGYTYAKIESDAYSMPVSYTATSKSSTVYGIETSSGRMLMRLGEITLESIDRANERLKLRRAAAIARSQASHMWSRASIMDVLELQRLHMYSDTVRAKAWEILFTMLERGGSNQLGATLASWSVAETKLFLRQLAVCRLSNWVVHPVSDYPGPVPRVRDSADASIVAGARVRVLTAAMAQLLSRLLDAEEYISILHDIFTADCFYLLCTGGLPLERKWESCLWEWGPGNFQFMASFLTSWASFQPWANLPEDVLSLDLLQMSTRMAELIDAQPEIQVMVRFLTTGPVHGLEPVISHLAEVLAIFSQPELDYSAVQRMYNELPGLLQKKIIYPCWIFLWMAAFLAYRSKAAAELLVRARVDQCVESLCARDFPGFKPESDDKYQTQMVLLRFVSYLMLSSIDKHQKIDSPVMSLLSGQLQGQNGSRVVYRLMDLHRVVEHPSDTPASPETKREKKHLNEKMLDSPEKQQRRLQERLHRDRAREVMAKRRAQLETQSGLDSTGFIAYGTTNF